jgi:hypothetical protein
VFATEGCVRQPSRPCVLPTKEYTLVKVSLPWQKSFHEVMKLFMKFHENIREKF